MVDDFVFTPPVKKVAVRGERKARKEPKRITYPTIHVQDRHGGEWPREPGKVYRWTGWLTHREYNLIESQLRFGHHDMYQLGDFMSLKRNSVERMYHSMVNAGVVTGSIDNFEITPLAGMLYQMTDEYMLGLDLGGDDE